ncbi:flagellar hook-length control protein FliK [Aquisalimonas sp.]|uniref:flagellar hook-length control protein FliK n=2 Tax=Aquisalimonas sp. TaxID=1872621 RepID=UPI0025C5D622|nr:flagellar hook-length control protein FliK [Aquisalimonas sp.]
MLPPSSTAQPGLLRIPETAPGASLRSWQAGQVIDAIARTATQNGRVTLQIGGAQIQARTEQPLQAGERIQVQVLRQEGGALTLRILPSEASREASEAMRQLLPRQGSSAGLMANVAQTVTQPSAQTRSLPEPVQQALRTFWQALPDSTQVSRSDGLRQAVADSGLHLERRLLAIGAGQEPPSVVRTDQKGQLSNLLSQVFRALDARPQQRGGEQQPPPAASQPRLAPVTAPRPPAPLQPAPQPGALPQPVAPLAQPATPGAAQATAADTQRGAAQQTANTSPPPGPQARGIPPPPPQAATLPGLAGAGEMLTELARQTDSTMARLQLTQLSLLAGEALPLFFELPVRDGRQIDLIQFHLERQAAGNEQDEDKTWRVMLSFNFEGLGPMHTVVHLSPDAVATTWWAERESTVRFLETQLDMLEERLQAMGFRVANMACMHGHPPSSDSPPTTGPHRGLLDEQA